MLDGLSWRDLRFDKSEYRDKRVLLLGRDVRDTLVLAYFHATRRLRFFTGTISAFVRDERYGVDKVLAFYRHWHAARQVPRAFMFVRYEAMHADPAGILGRVLQFIGTPDLPAATTAAAADFARFENLRDAEARNLFDNPVLATRPNADPEAFKVRRGKDRRIPRPPLRRRCRVDRRVRSRARLRVHAARGVARPGVPEPRPPSPRT